MNQKQSWYEELVKAVEYEIEDYFDNASRRNEKYEYIHFKALSEIVMKKVEDLVKQAIQTREMEISEEVEIATSKLASVLHKELVLSGAVSEKNWNEELAPCLRNFVSIINNKSL